MVSPFAELMYNGRIPAALAAWRRWLDVVLGDAFRRGAGQLRDPPLAPAEQSEVADPAEPLRHQMPREPPDEGRPRQRHFPRPRTAPPDDRSGEDLNPFLLPFQNLGVHFQFGGLIELSSRKTFLTESLPSLATESKQFFVRSSEYFQEDGGSVELVTDMEVFTDSRLISGQQLSVNVPQFSFTAWVATVPQFTEGYLLRKRMVPAGLPPRRTCCPAVSHIHGLEAIF